MRDPEYDRFGPWILEITESDPLPLLFVPYMTRKTEPLYCVKIPRQMDRRDLSPGMNMYDFVVVLYNEDLLILERDGDSVHTLIFRYSDISALKHTEDLLDGHLHIYLPDRSYSLPYSTVSSDIIEKIIGLIRERYVADSVGPAVFDSDPVPVPHSETLSFYFAGILKKTLSEHPGKTLISLQEEVAVHTVEARFWRRVLFGALDKRLLESLHFFDGRELEIVSRGRLWGYRWQAIYCRETLYLPKDKIRRTESIPDKNPGFVSLVFVTAGSGHTFLFRSDNPGQHNYRHFLSNERSTENKAV